MLNSWGIDKPRRSATQVDPRHKDRQVQFFPKSDNLRLATDNLILEVAKIERAASEEPEAAEAEPMRKTPRQEASSSLGSVLDEIWEEYQLEARSGPDQLMSRYRSISQSNQP
ncbi:hypothetical protein KUCAC02_012307 [Chaenocephalus aceratus]|uniref:Uncharacterized protein n=1 Tax=Chaenocephalus aceratus TaxID=36190 RepID=A0ACB9XB17_CHAAC|nr:hypothetical protein KUCAC02_012307 [Chaenocephalus aceratus]